MKKFLGIIVLVLFVMIQTNLSLADGTIVCRKIDQNDPNSKVECTDKNYFGNNTKSGGKVFTKEEKRIDNTEKKKIKNFEEKTY